MGDNPRKPSTTSTASRSSPLMLRSSKIQPTVVDPPVHERDDPLGSLLVLKMGPCTTTEDFEGFAENELLNFPGKNCHDCMATEAGTLHRMSAVAHPFRPALLQAGFSPRVWPDFQTTVTRRQKMALDKTSLFLKVSVKVEETGKEQVVGITWLTVPSTYKASQRTWLHLFKNQILHPVVDGLWGAFLDQSDGTYWGIIAFYKKEVKRMRSVIMGDKPYFAIEMFAVHPSYHGRGIGRALLRHCIGLATEENSPLILESTALGYPFYKANAFNIVDWSRIDYRGNSYEWPVMVWDSLDP